MFKHDVYHLVTIENGKDDAASINKVFSEIATGTLSADLRLLNYYHEVPVSYGARLNFVENGSVELEVHEHQAVIIKHDSSTLIKSKHFPGDFGVHCYASYVNVPKKTVILNNFAYAQIRAERRDAVRVKVKDEVPVIFSSDNFTVEGTMVDLSSNGISFLSSAVPAATPGESGSLSFRINNANLNLPATFVRAIGASDGQNVCVFQLKPNRKDETTIGQFIFQRQLEIIQELKDGVVIE